MRKSTFEKAFNDIENVIPFDIKWANGTGYFNGAVTADLGLKPGEVGKSVAGGEDKRRMIIIGTCAGNVVLFERYTPNEKAGENLVVVSNAPRGFHQTGLVVEGAMSDDHFMDVVGMYRQLNVSQRIDRIANMKEEMNISATFNKIYDRGQGFIDVEIIDKGVVNKEVDDYSCGMDTGIISATDGVYKAVKVFNRKNNFSVWIVKDELSNKTYLYDEISYEAPTRIISNAKLISIFNVGYKPTFVL